MLIVSRLVCFPRRSGSCLAVRTETTESEVHRRHLAVGVARRPTRRYVVMVDEDASLGHARECRRKELISTPSVTGRRHCDTLALRHVSDSILESVACLSVDRIIPVSQIIADLHTIGWRTLPREK